MTTYNGPSPEWLSRASDFEESTPCIAAGGMAAELGMFPSSRTRSREAFGRLIELSRRARGMTIESLAESAQVDPKEIVEIETNPNSPPTVETVVRLAQALKLPSNRLQELAGLAPIEPEISSAAARFASNSDPNSELSPDERAALEEFVEVLAKPWK